MAPVRSRPNRFIPRVTELEGRAVPAVSVTIRGDVLDVTGGKKTDDTVQIFDNPNDTVSVVADGQPHGPFRGIREIRVNTKGNTRHGQDFVSYTVTGTFRTQRAVFVNLGDGRDVFLARIQGDLEAGSLGLFVAGGDNDDDMTLEAANLPRGSGQPSGVTVAAAARFRADLNGESGNDTINYQYQGLMNGQLGMHLRGGKHGDRITARIAALDGSQGNVGETFDSVQVLGERDDDRLQFLLFAPPSARTFSVLDGGKDTDRCSAFSSARPVTVRGCDRPLF